MAYFSPDPNVERFGRITSRDSLTNFLENVGEDFGFGAFSLQHMPLHRKRTFDRDHITDNWNHPSFSQYYIENDIINKTQAPAFVSQSMLPVQLEIRKNTFNKNGYKFSIPFEIWHELGVELLALVPVFSSGGKLGLLSFSGKRARMTNRELMAMSLLGRYAFDHGCKVLSETPSDQVELSTKEQDCLSWSAKGKTTPEIASILSLSEPTINFHFGKAMKKLNAANRIQAVAKFMTQNAY